MNATKILGNTAKKAVAVKKKLNQVGASLSQVVDSLGTNLAPQPAILEKPSERQPVVALPKLISPPKFEAKPAVEISAPFV